uniref:Uncharacterized protein n=1 Tax=Timema tahoe TaxID=61484 RepID=A0A7R9IGM2_9NEOP|nr:unnamed protein product [Timema tahoe]
MSLQLNETDKNYNPKELKERLLRVREESTAIDMMLTKINEARNKVQILIMQQTSSLEILKLQRDNLLRGLSGENESVYVPPRADTNQPTITETTDSINAEAINIQVDPLKAMLAGTFIAPETFGGEEEEDEETLQEVPPSQLDTALHSFLTDYRIAPYTTTGISPAQALVGGQLRNHLDLLRPPQPLAECGKLKINRGQTMEESVPTPAVTLLEKVWVKSYRIESKWIGVKVEQILVPQSIQVYLPHLDVA